MTQTRESHDHPAQVFARECGAAGTPGEVLFLTEGTPRVWAMATGKPVLSDQLDDETAGQAAGHPDGPGIAADHMSFLAVPLTARGVTVGCAVFAITLMLARIR